MKQHAEIEVAREATFCNHNVKKVPDRDENTMQSPLIARFKGSSKTSEDDEM